MLLLKPKLKRTGISILLTLMYNTPLGQRVNEFFTLIWLKKFELFISPPNYLEHSHHKQGFPQNGSSSKLKNVCQHERDMFD